MSDSTKWTALYYPMPYKTVFTLKLKLTSRSSLKCPTLSNNLRLKQIKLIYKIQSN